jgi:signal transduction histidine kinase
MAKREGPSQIGLTLAKSLTEMQGGTLAIESEVDVGTLMTVALPAGRVLSMSEL